MKYFLNIINCIFFFTYKGFWPVPLYPRVYVRKSDAQATFADQAASLGPLKSSVNIVFKKTIWWDSKKAMVCCLKKYFLKEETSLFTHSAINLLLQQVTRIE